MLEIKVLCNSLIIGHKKIREENNYIILFILEIRLKINNFVNFSLVDILLKGSFQWIQLIHRRMYFTYSLTSLFFKVIFQLNFSLATIH
jgi:hypothetical protein